MGFKWLNQALCLASAFVSVDRDDARNPQRFIPASVVANAKTQTVNNNNQNLNDMKMINLLLTGFLLFGISCSKDEPEKEQTLKEKLIGKWTEVSPCESCNTFTFLQNDSILQTVKFDDTIYSLFYVVLDNDSIQVTRNWDIEQTKKTTKHKVVFLSSDTIRIIQFLPVDFGITGFEDVTLTKSK